MAVIAAIVQTIGIIFMLGLLSVAFISILTHDYKTTGL
jgi:hypothetical protein